VELKPGYKLTEVGIIPENWDVSQLGDLFEITSSKRVFQSEWKSRGVPFYRARELVVLGELGSVDNDLFISREMYEQFKMQHGVPAPGDMLVTGVGTLGKTYVVDGDQEFYFKDGNIIWFKIGQRVSPGFLQQLYRTPVVIKQIGDGSTGTTVGTYTISAAKRTVIPRPPLPEQHAISEALSDADALLDGLDWLLAKKRDTKLATMQQLLSGATRLPGYSGEWKSKRLGEEITDLLAGVSVNSVARKPGQYLTGPAILKTSCIAAGKFFPAEAKIIDPVDLHRVRLSVQADTVLISRMNTIDLIGECGYVDVDHPDHFIPDRLWMTRFRPGANMSARWLAFALSTRWARSLIRNIATGTSGSMKNISKSAFLDLEFRMPDRAEQTAIAAVLSDMDAELAALEARREKTRALKQAMMQELLTGRTRLVDAPAASVP